MKDVPIVPWMFLTLITIGPGIGLDQQERPLRKGPTGRKRNEHRYFIKTFLNFSL